MENITLDKINKNILLLRKEVEKMNNLMQESYLELDEEIDDEVEQSRKKDKKELISHEEMKKEFGNDDD